jgi:hypothetical protein
MRRSPVFAMIEHLMSENERLLAENERLREALTIIAEIPKAYPADVFTEPDWKRADEVLTAAGMRLDGISGSNMRWRSEKTAEIARAALADQKESGRG